MTAVAMTTVRLTIRQPVGAEDADAVDRRPPNAMQ
jgi:hypothetical protein